MKTTHLLWGGFGLIFALAMMGDRAPTEIASIAAEPAASADAGRGDDGQSFATLNPDAPMQTISGFGEVRLQRQRDGHFYANPAIGLTQPRVLVDTGASVVALTGRDARNAGIFWDDADVIPIGEGASGVVHGVPIMLDTVELGGFVATNVEAAIIPEGLPVTLLGQSFLSRIDRVQIEGDQMVLASD